jgi:hypothetical protein
VYLNNTNGAQIFNFSAAGVFYQRHFRYLHYGERLIFVATGITGTAAVWLNGIQYQEIVAGQALL